MIEINNRRYIGNKYKLLGDISREISARMTGAFTFADLFAGTGAVAYKMAREGHPVIVNDTLYSNVVAYRAWFSQEEIRAEEVASRLARWNALADAPENYFSRVYGGKYYSGSDARKIGHIREELERERGGLREREYFVLLASLLYAADKIANTVGHFEYFLKEPPQDRGVIMQMPDLAPVAPAEIFNEDANALAKRIRADVVYIDPPYNARQYVNFYHVLENLARWEKPEKFEGNSMKFERNALKSGYSRASAPALFEDLIRSLRCRLIVVSYNNTYKAGSSASVNKIGEDELVRILSMRGKVFKREIDYSYFNAGKTEFEGHKEYIFVCEVKDGNE